jgi:hypothetical protein
MPYVTADSERSARLLFRAVLKDLIDQELVDDEDDDTLEDEVRRDDKEDAAES